MIASARKASQGVLCNQSARGKVPTRLISFLRHVVDLVSHRRYLWRFPQLLRGSCKVLGRAELQVCSGHELPCGLLHRTGTHARHSGRLAKCEACILCKSWRACLGEASVWSKLREGGGRLEKQSRQSTEVGNPCNSASAAEVVSQSTPVTRT